MEPEAESWAAFGLRLGLTVAAKIALNACVPGSSSTVDFAQAGNCLKNGDNVGFFINTVSGIADFVTCGLASTTKEVMKESAKGAAVQTAKETAKSASKEATKKVGQDLSKQLAMGMINGGKDAAIETAKATAKKASQEASKKVGKEVAEAFVKGMITGTVGEVWNEGTKMTCKGMVQTGFLGMVSSGGREVVKTTFEDVFEETMKSGAKKVLFEATKQSNEKIVSELFKNAAKKAAEEEFKKNSCKFILKDVAVAGVKGIINYSANKKDQM